MKSKYLRACLESFFQSHFDDILSEKPEDRRSIAMTTLRRSEGFAAKIAQNGVGRIDSKQALIAIAAAVVTLSGILFFSQYASNTANDSASNNLYPEQTISHGHGLAVDVKDSKKLYIATHHGLFALTDERDLFRVGKSPVDFHTMAVSSVNPNIIYGWYQGNLQRSIDQGKNWEIVNSDLLAVYLAADSQDDNTVYAATPRGQGVMISRDKGATWTSLSPALEGGAISVIAIHPQDSKILLTFSEKLGGLGKSIDDGVTWKKVAEEFGGETILHIAFNRSESNIVYALTHQNKLYKSVDTGDAWNLIR